MLARPPERRSASCAPLRCTSRLGPPNQALQTLERRSILTFLSASWRFAGRGRSDLAMEEEALCTVSRLSSSSRPWA